MLRSRLEQLREFARPPAIEEIERATHTRVPIRMGANENPFPLPERVWRAFEQSERDLALYGDPASCELREILAELHGVQSDFIHVGAGIDMLVADTCSAFLEPGGVVAMVAGTYQMVKFAALRVGGHVCNVNYRDGRAPTRELGEVARAQGARLVYLANPDNPAGCTYSPGELRELAELAGPQSLLLLDEAYLDFSDDSGALPYAETVETRMLRYRTLSKLYGLAGLKIGYVVGREDLVADIAAMAMPYGVGRFAQRAAQICLQDESLAAEMLGSYRAAASYLVDELRRLGIGTRPCATNFLLADFRSQQARDGVQQFLLRNGVLTRAAAGSGHESLLRVSLAARPEAARFIELVEEFLGDRTAIRHATEAARWEAP
jgi:histidinol-phosphate aminotransferase